MSNTTNRGKAPWEKDSNWWKGPEKESFSTMNPKDFSHVYDQSRNTFKDLIKLNDLEIPYKIADKGLKPYALVTFYKIECDKNDTKEVEIARSPLYDLNSIDKVHCIGVGRNPENQFKPLIHSDSVVPFIQNMQDIQVSREHGLVFLEKKKDKLQVCYRDIGTKIDDKRHGSTNGTWLNDRTKISNLVWDPWEENDYLAIGQCLFKGDNTSIGRQFRLRYQTLGESQDDKLSS